MLTLLITGAKSTEVTRNIEHIVIFKNNEAGHPRPVISVNHQGIVYKPVKIGDFYDYWDELEKRLYEAENEI